MAYTPERKSVVEQTWVALDLETTGLDNNVDEIIEVGAVKFRGSEVLDSYQTFVNPYKKLSEFIVNYTHITQADVDFAPPFAVVAGELASFVGDLPVVGHNVYFDVGFLDKKGLNLANSLADTWDMAYVLLPEAPEYALGLLASALGIEHSQPHRALADADVTRRVFVKLLEKAFELDLGALAELQRLSTRSQWVLGYLVDNILRDREEVVGHRGAGQGLLGVDQKELSGRLAPWEAIPPNEQEVPIDIDELRDIIGEGGAISRTLPSYEPRQEQMEMAVAVARAINEKRHLIVEGGTGVGKSLAYLLPAILFSTSNGKRVVVSTNTINLQEQLVNKDVPAIEKALKAGFSATQLKGRANYLCMRRWLNMLRNDTLSSDEARLLAKVLVWLKSTSTGDRAELNLTGRSAFHWDKISASSAPECLMAKGVCFLRSARNRAAGSHVIVVNHALLLSDLTMGGGLIPNHDLLIIDEAHHLEDEATKHLGFQLAQGYLEDHVQGLTGQGGLLQMIAVVFRASNVGASRKRSVEEFVEKLTQAMPETREAIARFYQAVRQFIQNHRGQLAEGEDSFRMTDGRRKQPGWSRVETAWEDINASMKGLSKGLQELLESLDDLDEAVISQYQILIMDLVKKIQSNDEIEEQLAEFVPHPREDRIYWVLQSKRDGTIILNAAPLNVGRQLEDMLFSQKERVILTSATLSTNGSFEHIRQRVGLSESRELVQGSPFDYKKAALVCVPEDMPEPNSWSYQAALEKAVVDVARSVQGRTLVLFTSHNALQATASSIRASLASRDIQVLAQGVDGPPKRLISSFLRNPRSVILGTSSFWEGVDLAGGSLKALVLVRLPFNVPTDPVFQARSELFEYPFNEYAIPQAILRFRQGFGRLIRGKSDRGVVILLDRRITSRSYGKAFLDSLPDCTFRRCSVRAIGEEISHWVGVSS